jgi:lysophospholipase L1-like esterase
MNHQRFLTQVIVYPLVFLLLAACGTAEPTPTPTDTPIPEPTAALTPVSTEALTEWLYVALGDSEAVCCGLRSYPQYYAEFIEQDLNIKVQLRNLGVSGLTSGELLERLGTERYQDAIREAQVVTVVITMNDLLSCPQGNRECAEERLVTAMANYSAILEEILKLRSTKDTIIRAQTYDNPFVNRWKEQGVFDERKSMLDRWNQQIVEIATKYYIQVARVYQDFNGLDGDQDPGDKGYISTDGLHNNDAGAQRIAELLRELGYEPLAP